MKTFLIALFAAGFVFGQGYSGASDSVITTQASGSTSIVSVVQEPVVAQVQYFLAVARGLVPGASSVNKFGHNLATTSGEDVWGGGGMYGFYPATGQTVYSQSTHADDDAAGSGVQEVTYHGLDANGFLANETVATDGTTPVQLTNTYIRLFRGISGATGGSDSNVGVLTVTNAAGTVAIDIDAEDGQTQQAIYTIPAGKTGRILKWECGISDGGNAASRESVRFKLLTRAPGEAWLVKGEAECINDGSTHFSDLYVIPSGPLAPMTDIRGHCFFASTELGTIFRFDIELTDN